MGSKSWSLILLLTKKMNQIQAAEVLNFEALKWPMHNLHLYKYFVSPTSKTTDNNKCHHFQVMTGGLFMLIT